ncbi:MAG TPA: GGDEF domain-containing protein [Pyrinomonadaceae bacterium]|jgi:diguanylate cyclase (GGDEF)-like protein
MLRLINFLGKQSKPFLLALSFLLVVLIGLFDRLTGPDVSLLVFFLIPIFLAVWFVGKRAGLLVSIISAAAWLTNAIIDTHPYAHPSIPYWNVLLRLIFLLIFTYMLAAFKMALEHEQELARTDYLTGVANRRFFYELAHIEIRRARRHARPLTIAYMDIDDFKEVNDQSGHTTGDVLLRRVSETIRRDVREIDVLARLGGDEFAILLPETGEEAARAVVRRVQRSLLEMVKEHNWPVTFSVGVVTWVTPPQSVDEVVKRADQLMYSVKNSGKNMIRHEVFGEQLTAA